MTKIYTITDQMNKAFSYQKIKKKGYKYKTAHYYSVNLNFMPGFALDNNFFSISADGLLGIRAAYAWDGASGPTFDTKSTMRASCVHDVLYQAIRENLLPLKFKDDADRELARIMIEDSNTSWFNRFRAKYYYWGVRLFGRWSCVPNPLPL